MLLLVKSWYTIVMKTNTLPGAYIVYSSCTQTGSRSLEELNLSEESEYKSSIPAAGCVVNGGGDQTHSTPRSSRGPRSSHTRDQEVRRRLYMRSIVLKPLDITRGGGKRVLIIIHGCSCMCQKRVRERAHDTQAIPAPRERGKNHPACRRIFSLADREMQYTRIQREVLPRRQRNEFSPQEGGKTTTSHREGHHSPAS